MSIDALLWIAVAGWIATCFAAAAARALEDFSRHELEDIAQRRRLPERFADILHEHERVALGIDMLVALVYSVAIVAASIWAWQTFGGTDTLWLSFAFVVLPLSAIAILATVWIPWCVSRVAAAGLLFRFWPMLRFLGKLTLPMVWCAGVIDSLLHRAVGRNQQGADEESFEEEIRSIVSEGHREGLLEEEAREMIEGVIDLNDAIVSHIMTPRTDIHMIAASTSWDDVVKNIVKCGHTRVPVYDKSRDEIIGMLYSKDLLHELAKPSPDKRRPLTALLRKPLFVPETKPVDDLLRLFQKSRTHIAVVLDEYGGVSGIVTIEDVLEEIVGEIDDEYDQQAEQEINRIDDDVCEALGRAHVDEINDEMDFDLPEDEDYDTIGGFVFAEFGRVPSAGESIIWQDSIRVTVLEATRRRVNRVRLERVRKESLELASD